MTGPPGAGRITGFWHAGITVADLDESLAFYRDELGLAVTARSSSSAVAEKVWNLPGATGRIAFLAVPGSDVSIELIEFGGVERHPASARPCDPAHGHICLVVDDLDALHARLASRGHRARSDDVVTLVGGAAPGGKSVYLVDPDGYHVELFQHPPTTHREGAS